MLVNKFLKILTLKKLYTRKKKTIFYLVPSNCIIRLDHVVDEVRVHDRVWDNLDDVLVAGRPARQVKLQVFQDLVHLDGEKQ